MEDREIVKEVSDIVHSDEEDVVNSIKKFKKEIREMERDLENLD